MFNIFKIFIIFTKIIFIWHRIYIYYKNLECNKYIFIPYNEYLCMKTILINIYMYIIYIFNIFKYIYINIFKYF